MNSLYIGIIGQQLMKYLGMGRDVYIKLRISVLNVEKSYRKSSKIEGIFA